MYEKTVLCMKRQFVYEKWHINEHVLCLFVVLRFGRLLSPAVQHHALPVLQSWRHLLLCQQK